MSPSRFTGPVGLLALWRRWGRGEGDPTEESALSAAALAALNILGAALSMLWLVLPHPGRAQALPIAAATFALCAVATVLIAGRQPKPSWLLQTAIAVDTFVVSVCLVATGDASSVYAFAYLWVGLYAACFFGLRQVAIHAAWLGIAYAGSLALLDAAPVARLTQWLLPMVTLLATGTLLRQLINRPRRNEARLRHAAGHDPLTGLANRGLFAARLEAALAEPGATCAPSRSSTSITSSPSTTASGTRSAMPCWSRSPSGFVSTRARRLLWLASAATSSWRSCTARAGRRSARGCCARSSDRSAWPATSWP